TGAIGAEIEVVAERVKSVALGRKSQGAQPAIAPVTGQAVAFLAAGHFPQVHGVAGPRREQQAAVRRESEAVRPLRMTQLAQELAVRIPQAGGPVVAGGCQYPFRRKRHRPYRAVMSLLADGDFPAGLQVPDIGAAVRTGHQPALVAGEQASMDLIAGSQAGLLQLFGLQVPEKDRAGMFVALAIASLRDRDSLAVGMDGEA